MNMKHIDKLLVILVLLAVGCVSLPTAVVSIKDAHDLVAAEYARLYNAGVITPEIDNLAEAADAEYRAAMGALGDALETYKATGDDAGVPEALRAAKVAVTRLLDLIASHLSTEKTAKLGGKIAVAHE